MAFERETVKKLAAFVSLLLFSAIAVAQKPEHWFEVTRWVHSDPTLGPMSTFINTDDSVVEEGFRGFSVRTVYQNPVLDDSGWKEKTVYYVVEIDCDTNKVRSKRVSLVDVNGATHLESPTWSMTGVMASKDIAHVVKGDACTDASGRDFSKLTVYDSPGFQVTFDLRRGETLSFTTVDGKPKTYSITAPKVRVDSDDNWTETISFTDFPSEVTNAQIEAAVPSAKAWLEAVTRCSPDGTCHEHVKIEEYRKQHVSVNTYYSGWEFTWGATWEDTDCYYRIFAIGNRLYQMSVLTGSREDPDEDNLNKSESLRFFNSFKTKKKG